MAGAISTIDNVVQSRQKSLDPEDMFSLHLLNKHHNRDTYLLVSGLHLSREGPEEKDIVYIIESQPDQATILPLSSVCLDPVPTKQGWYLALVTVDNRRILPFLVQDELPRFVVRESQKQRYDDYVTGTLQSTGMFFALQSQGAKAVANPKDFFKEQQAEAAADLYEHFQSYFYLTKSPSRTLHRWERKSGDMFKESYIHGSLMPVIGSSLRSFHFTRDQLKDPWELETFLKKNKESLTPHQEVLQSILDASVIRGYQQFARRRALKYTYAIDALLGAATALAWRASVPYAEVGFGAVVLDTLVRFCHDQYDGAPDGILGTLKQMWYAAGKHRNE